MKAYRVYTGDEIVDAVVASNNDDEFWDMVDDNGWVVGEITND